MLLHSSLAISSGHLVPIWGLLSQTQWTIIRSMLSMDMCQVPTVAMMRRRRRWTKDRSVNVVVLVEPGGVII